MLVLLSIRNCKLRFSGSPQWHNVHTKFHLNPSMRTDRHNQPYMCSFHAHRTKNAKTTIISLNSVNQLIFVMVKSCVFFAVRTEFLNII
jgi:hypothetical protein